ncbi:m-AAA protease-interacting protein 1, mitochondrial isoform X2 [Echeneis naucrates]|uniref:M-AAA protease-interacting protein 1, mitochondrial-like n=1 Tax=Echeneis naucrates TaxID=173247 RepID=A0A665UGJ6_ECHNA|nr:m-AAA protease-interacting protein 1, mitochondrial-like isoform X2 [Echeneis naucrates]
MHRIVGLAACRDLGRPGVCSWTRGPGCSGRPAVHLRQCAGPARPFTAEPRPGVCGRKVVFAGQKHRLLSSRAGADKPTGSSGGQPDISVVGSPDPVTWIRCKIIMYLIQLYFKLDVSSEEFDRGIKQMLEYVETRCQSLNRAQRQQLAVTMDDIIFVFPEEVSVVFEEDGRRFCFISTRFWFLSTYQGPDDPEGTQIFKVAPHEDGSPQRKIATAVYEFRRELTKGASPDWKVTAVWHWHWKLAE